MEGDHIAARVDQRARGLLDAGQEVIDGEMVGAGHAQARDMHLHAGRKGLHHLLLDHPVRGRNDEADARGHGHRFSRRPARSSRGSTSSQKNGSSSM